MDEKLSDKIFKGKAREVKKLVDAKIKELEKKHCNYMKDNKIKKGKYYKFNFDEHNWEFGITNKEIADSDFAQEIEKEVTTILSDHSQ